MNFTATELYGAPPVETPQALAGPHGEPVYPRGGAGPMPSRLRQGDPDGDPAFAWVLLIGLAILFGYLSVNISVGR